MALMATPGRLWPTNPKYSLPKNWSLYSAIGKKCKNNFPFPILQLQAASEAAQLRAIFASAAAECPNVAIEWVTNASHFGNFNRPEQVIQPVNPFLQTMNH